MLTFKIVQNGTFEMTLQTGVTDNRPTCSLIQSEGCNVLIDLDHPVKDKSDIICALAAHGLTPQQIDVIVLTHLHPDHIGHKDLFTNALFVFHKDEKLKFYFKDNKKLELDGDIIYDLDGPGKVQDVQTIPDIRNLGNCLYIRHCPGHTKGSLVIFSCIHEKVCACVGGIFLNNEYYKNWEPPGMSWKQEWIYRHMTFIKENADIVIPAHGVPFYT